MTDEAERARDSDDLHPIDSDHVDTSQPGHADTGTAAGVGGVTGAAIGAAAGPIGAAIGAVGGMLVGAAAERAMHTDDDRAAAAQHSEADPLPADDARRERRAPEPPSPLTAMDEDDPLP